LPRLVELLESDLPASERADAGRLLGKLGDPRPEVMTLDAMPFCLVPAGAFWMGSEKKRDPDSTDDERPCKQVDLPAHYIGRYPVTNAQYREFVAAGGYADTRFWPEAQAAGYWGEGQFKGRWDDEPRQAADDFGEPFNLPNHPVVGVNWYETLAFARWLTERWTSSGRLPANWTVALPTERQWEKAARGGVQIPAAPRVVPVDKLLGATTCEMQPNADARRIYPWLGKLTPDHANYADSRIEATSAVGAFPKRASPYGALDMSGNVWEWCLTRWRENYKGEPDDRPGGEDDRVLRGGAFSSYARLVRCAVRNGGYPYARSRLCGFRVVASPIIHDSGR
jgi:formylglycine-generating enzyme required for sulfatase activity